MIQQPLHVARERPVRRRSHGRRRRPVGPGRRGAPRHLEGAAPFEPELSARPLKKAGFLTRDSRVVERKKYGKAKARRSFQFSKR
jgi:hypothetical protein